MLIRRMILVLGMLAAFAAGAQLPPEDAAVPNPLQISGFGTLSYTSDSRHDMALMRDVTQRPEKSYRSGDTWKLDSRFGLQASYRLTQNIDLVGQVLVRDQLATGFDSVLELAYAAWRPTHDVDVRLGRVGYDAFLMSDTRNVGYAYPWVRPFPEFYGWTPIYSVDGADVVWTIPHGDGQWRLKGQAGTTRMTVPMGEVNVDLQSNDLASMTLMRQSGPWRIKAGFSSFTIHNKAAPLRPLQAGLEAVAAATAAPLPAISAEARGLRHHLETDNTRVTYFTLGGAYDDGRWFAQAELSRSTLSRDLIAHGTMGYGALGYRVGHWMPYLAFSAARPGNRIRQPAADWSLIGQTALQTIAITNLNQTRMDQRTLSLGTRWDFYSNAALKLQWETTHVAPAGYGMWFWDPALIDRSGRINQVSLALEFMF